MALESRLIIKATDETAGAFAEVKKRITEVERSVGELDKVFSSISRVTRATDPLAGSLMSMEKALASQRTELAGVAAALDRIVSPIDRAAAAQRNLSRWAERTTAAFRAQGEVVTRTAERTSAAASREGHAAAGHGLGGILPSGAGLIEQAKGIIPLVAAMETFEVGKKAVENAAELEQQRFRIRELSKHDPSEAPLADRLAADVAAKYPSIGTTKALDNYQEMRANSVDANGRVDPAIAQRNMMAAARAQNAALAIGVEMTPVDMQNLLKGIEGSGRASDPKAVEKISDAYLRAKQVFGTAIASNLLRDYVANAKSANFSIGDDQFYLGNFVRMSEGNASRFGNEESQTLQTLLGGHMTKATGQWLVDHKLARADQIVKTGPSSVAIKGGIKEAALLGTSTEDWAAGPFRKAIEDSGAISDSKVDARMKMLRDQELKRNPNATFDDRSLRERAEHGLFAAEIMKMGVRGSVADDLAHWLANHRLIERDNAAMQNASGLEAGDRIRENPVAAFAELTSAISNFGTVLVAPAMKAAAPLLDDLAHGIASLTAALPAAFEKIAAAAHALGVFLGGEHAGIAASDDWNSKAWREWRIDVAKKRQAEQHPLIWGQPDMETAHASALSRLIDGGHVAAAAQEINVHGDATVKVPVTVTVTASSQLISIVERAENASKTAQMALNPVATGHSGRMDSDAAPVGRGSWDR